MPKTARKSAADIRDRHVMSSRLDPLSHARDGLLRIRQPKIMQFYLMARLDGLSKQSHVCAAAQRALQREGFPFANVVMNLMQQQTRRFHRSCSRIKR